MSRQLTKQPMDTNSIRTNLSNHRVLIAAGIGVAALYLLNRARENYYAGEKVERAARRRLRRLEEGMTSVVQTSGFIPVSKPVPDQFPISRFNPPRIQGRKV